MTTEITQIRTPAEKALISLYASARRGCLTQS